MSSSSISTGASGPVPIHKDGCRSVIFTVVANTKNLQHPIFKLRMGDQSVATTPEASPRKSRVFGSLTMPYGGERMVYLEAESKSGRTLGKHVFDLRKIPNIYSFYDGTVQLSKKGKVLGTLSIRIDLSKKKVKKVVDRTGIFAMCTGPGTANFESNVVKKGNLCNAVVSDGSSIDHGRRNRREIFLNKSDSSKSLDDRVRKMHRATDKSDSLSSSTRSRSPVVPVAATAAYGTALKSRSRSSPLSRSSSSRDRSSPSVAKLSSSHGPKSSPPRVQTASSSISRSGPRGSISRSGSSSVSSGARVVAVPAMNYSSSTSSRSAQRRSHSSSSSSNRAAVVHHPAARSVSSHSSSRAQPPLASPRPVSVGSRIASSNVNDAKKDKFSCGKICGGKKQKASPANPEADGGKTKKRRRTGRKVAPASAAVATTRRDSSCSSVRSNVASSCLARNTKSSSSSSRPVAPAAVARSQSNSLSSLGSNVSGASARRRRRRASSVSSVASRKSGMSCTSRRSTGSRVSCASKLRKPSRSLSSRSN